jgi:hypothetical protein
MAALEAKVKSAWKQSLQSCSSPWIAIGISNEGLPSFRLNGMAGLADWHLHGQVSSLLARGRLSAGEFCLIPGSNGQPNFLIYHFAGAPESKPLLGRLRALKVKELSFAASTFPGDFSSKLKQTLDKEGIRCTTLEPDT